MTPRIVLKPGCRDREGLREFYFSGGGFLGDPLYEDGAVYLAGLGVHDGVNQALYARRRPAVMRFQHGEEFVGQRALCAVDRVVEDGQPVDVQPVCWLQDLRREPIDLVDDKVESQLYEIFRRLQHAILLRKVGMLVYRRFAARRRSIPTPCLGL